MEPRGPTSSSGEGATRLWLVVLSPLAVILIGHLSARLFAAWWGPWAWVGTFFVYWSVTGAMVLGLAGRARLKAWFHPPRGSVWWGALALALGLVAFPLLLLPNIRLLGSLPLAAAWFLFGVVNSVCEEVYWRGFLLEGMSRLPRAFALLWSALLFTAIHPLMLGVFSQVQAFDPARPIALAPFLVIVIILALGYSLMFLATRSLWWPVLSHFLSDLGSLSVFVFMNMLATPGPR